MNLDLLKKVLRRENLAKKRKKTRKIKLRQAPITKNCSICLQPPKFCCSNMPLFQLLISRSVFSPIRLLACIPRCRAALARHLQPRSKKHYSNTSPNLILHVQTRPPIAAELLSFSLIPPLLVGILRCVPTSYNIVVYPTPATVLLVRYVPCTVVPGIWKGHCIHFLRCSLCCNCIGTFCIVAPVFVTILVHFPLSSPFL